MLRTNTIDDHERLSMGPEVLPEAPRVRKFKIEVAVNSLEDVMAEDVIAAAEAITQDAAAEREATARRKEIIQDARSSVQTYVQQPTGANNEAVQLFGQHETSAEDDTAHVESIYTQIDQTRRGNSDAII